LGADERTPAYPTNCAVQLLFVDETGGSVVEDRAVIHYIVLPVTFPVSRAEF
jgi:hypothetical protein